MFTVTLLQNINSNYTNATSYSFTLIIFRSTFANIEDPDEMQHNAAFIRFFIVKVRQIFRPKRVHFSVAREAWSTHRDHDSVGVVVRGVTLLVSPHKIQVKFKIGGHLLNFDLVFG